MLFILAFWRYITVKLRGSISQKKNVVQLIGAYIIDSNLVPYRSRNLSKHCFAASSSNPKLVARLSNRSCPFIFERRILNFGNGSCEFSSTTAIRRGLRAIDLVSYVFPLFFKRCRLFSIGWALRPFEAQLSLFQTQLKR